MVSVVNTSGFFTPVPPEVGLVVVVVVFPGLVPLFVAQPARSMPRNTAVIAIVSVRLIMGSTTTRLDRGRGEGFVERGPGPCLTLSLGRTHLRRSFGRGARPERFHWSFH